MKKRIFIIDGNSLIHRAFHAMRSLMNKEGQATHAVYGFLKMLLRLIKDENPDGMAVAFDIGKTFRHEAYKEYKAQRKKTDEDLVSQFPILKDVLKYMGIPILTAKGFEADDVLGTVACKGKATGDHVYVVTGDKDSLQLIDNDVTVYLTRKGLSQIEKLDVLTLKETSGLDPDQVKDIKGLQGDASDNIKGVPGIGEKTALKLITAYGDLEGVYNHLDDLKGKVKENLIKYKDEAFFCRDLATIHCDVPISYDAYPFGLALGNKEALKKLLLELEFKSLLGEFGIENAEDEKAMIPIIEPVVHYEINTFLKDLEGLEGTQWTLYLKLNELQEISLCSIYNGKKPITLEVSFPMPAVTEAVVSSLLRKGGNFISFDSKPLFHLFLAESKKITSFKFYDLRLMAYIVHPEKTYNIDSFMSAFMGAEVDKAYYTQNLWHIYEIIKKQLEEGNVFSVYNNIEKPLLPILCQMEHHGVALNRETLKKMESEIEEKISGLSHDIFALAGEEFNINSPQQLGKILFEKLELPPLKKTKTGYSTNQEVLEKLEDKHPIITLILEYRKVTKLFNTYIQGLLTLTDKDRVVHTTYNQTVAVTGRLSSENPNLQNIPIRMKEGRLIRKAFVPVNARNYFLSADYSQVELRVLAHISGDKNLQSAFLNGEDIHTKTASEVFDVPMSEVTKDMRRKAKAVNFGIVYGISDFGLSRDLNIPMEESKLYIEKYFSRYPDVRRWIDETLMEAKKTLKVSTLTGRYRLLSDLKSSKCMVRSGAERMAMNAPIQGTAADLIKIAMIHINDALIAEALESVMVLQVHDELIFEVPENEIDKMKVLIADKMSHAMTLDVPLELDMKIGKNWYDMEEL
ncbi:hypothetical protein AZF37_07550 [endosymbiont 'TC1' of Trimyema compressum]|uniref:DNA polymerase I n=1 Tax=endosymbiont 'TC1' of Trimyema compressum TaxID=243899 RepID=UPI0007F15457|nr:DNA polymerase I [endosymbiont 'TC1' of Trimyema compressum]AMP21035.1 hypothetical protein AZF37_07550 [endosymbiont 'TC1' of Trimyema compressum]